MIPSETLNFLWGVITLVISAGIFVWGVKKTWQMISPFIIPMLKWVRDFAIKDHIKEEERNFEQIRERLEKHERRRQHEQD